MNKAEKFSKNVLSEKLVAPNFIKLACQRFEDFKKRKDIEYRPAEAEKVIKFFETELYQWEGEWQGKPFKLEGWQQFIFHNIFAFYKNGRRLTTTAYVQIPRKNGKTALLAGTAVYHLYADKTKTPQVLVGANSEDQAKICTTAAANMIKASPNLMAYIDAGIVSVYSYKDRCSSISHKKRQGAIMAMSKDIKSKDGFNPSVGIVDEYHMADDSRLLDVIESGQGSRPEPLTFVITTSGYKKQGPCYSMLRRVAIDVLKGISDDDSQFSMIYEPDTDDNWEDEKTWEKVNPNYGVSVFPHYLKGRYKKAKNEGAGKEVEFKTKNLNVWTDSAVVWVTDENWMKCAGERSMEGKKWNLGLDMGLTRDYSSLVMVSDADKNGVHDVYSFHWIPEESVSEKALKDNSNIPNWIRDGLIFTTDGNITDHRVITDFIIKLNEKHIINQVVCDPAFAISIMNDLNDQGIETIGLPQSPSRLTPPTVRIYELILKQKLRHGGDPVLRWMLGNCLLKTFSNDLIKVMKDINSTQRIDGIDALINAVSPFDLNEEKLNHIAELWN